MITFNGVVYMIWGSIFRNENSQQKENGLKLMQPISFMGFKLPFLPIRPIIFVFGPNSCTCWPTIGTLVSETPSNLYRVPSQIHSPSNLLTSRHAAAPFAGPRPTRPRLRLRFPRADVSASRPHTPPPPPPFIPGRFVRRLLVSARQTVSSH
jgi:hypothetical protein